ncbi:hypothetical protein DACRYDRAFT_47534 [Dacryopinax primogenitus]|uniref:RecA family profile 1 domain-containing protein n=1 Tax=Dacryopinax primogenitus (strain DJM 731) TaxID=1858805 RepID=M5G3K4_DACPD|nr:uncharacterized protein DACRYDRAFT_47534 [Dacryopinax primogenitus]EJU04811.1 hypothetical protein DACRYDRAFT_47534 [Dacryopinax primogenitus]
MRLRAALISLSKQGHDYSPCADALEEAGLKTSDDLLFTTSTSEQYARLPGGTLSFPEFAALKEDVSKFVAPHPLTGEEAYLLAMGTEAQRYEGLCGVPELDALLGGFGQYGVLEFSGGRESCKTLLAFHIVLRYLSSERKGKALWIDTSNSFNVQRALAVTRLLPGLGVGDALDRLAYSTCFDVDPALGVLDDIRQSIDLRGERVDTTTPRFIVIDAITPLLSKEISSVSSQGPPPRLPVE